MITIIILGAVERFQSDHPEIKGKSILGYTAMSYETLNALPQEVRDSLRPKWPPDLSGPSGKTEQIFQYENLNKIPPERKLSPEPSSASFVGSLLTIRNVNIDLAHARDTLLALRDTVYCPECRCPNWLAEGSGVIIHYENCRLGKLTEAFLKIVPKDDVRFRWKSN